jgi:hypothetical protein
MDATATLTPIDALERKHTRVRVVMGGAILEGDHPHPPGVRLSESLRNAASHERYFLLNDVTIHQLDGSVAHGDLAAAPFILINMAQAHAIIPLEDQ